MKKRIKIKTNNFRSKSSLKNKRKALKNNNIFAKPNPGRREDSGKLNMLERFVESAFSLPESSRHVKKLLNTTACVIKHII